MTTPRSFEFTGLEKVIIVGVTVHQIRATRDIPSAGVKAGDVGGWIESAELTNGDARVSGDAWVSGNAQVSGDARVERTWDYIAVGPIGSENVTATLVRTGTGHLLNVCCWTGTLDGLRAEVEKRRRGWGADAAVQEVWVAQYEALFAMGMATASRWEARS